MIRISGTATMSDGRVIPFSGGPREWMQWERYAVANGLPAPNLGGGGVSAPLTFIFFLTYACCTRGQPERPSLDDWCDGLADVDDFAVEEPPPTPAAASAAPSASSPPEPESRPNSSGKLTPPTWQPSSRS